MKSNNAPLPHVAVVLLALLLARHPEGRLHGTLGSADSPEGLHLC